MPGLPDPASPIPAVPQALFEEAARFVDCLVRAFPDKPDALELKARLLYWFGKSKLAVESWEECLRLDPKYAYAHVGIGMAAAAQEDYGRAVMSLRKAVELEPGYFPARVELAKALIALNQPKDVAAILEDYLRRDPRSQGFFLLGQAHAQMQQFEKARENFEAAIQKFPNYGEAYYRLSTVYARLGQQEKAGQCLQKSRELKAEQRQDERVKKNQYDDLDAVRNRVAETYSDAAALYFAHNQHREAERLWRRAADLAPKNIECRQGLAWLCRQQVRVPEAVVLLKQLAALQPKNPGIWSEIGRMHADLTEFADASAALGRAMELDPGNPQYRAAYESAKKRAGGRAEKRDRGGMQEAKMGRKDPLLEAPTTPQK
jgi:superkiller protein 3